MKQSDKPKKKKLKALQDKLEELADEIEAKKTAKPDLETVFADVTKCLEETSKQAKELRKITAAVNEYRTNLNKGAVVLIEEY